MKALCQFDAGLVWLQLRLGMREMAWEKLRVGDSLPPTADDNGRRYKLNRCLQAARPNDDHGALRRPSLRERIVTQSTPRPLRRVHRYAKHVVTSLREVRRYTKHIVTRGPSLREAHTVTRSTPLREALVTQNTPCHCYAESIVTRSTSLREAHRYAKHIVT